MADDPKLYPVRLRADRLVSGKAPEAVYLAAYEVYREVYGAQESLLRGGCRGGFSTGELIAFLYARAFPKAEWLRRAEEAFRGLVV